MEGKRPDSAISPANAGEARDNNAAHAPRLMVAVRGTLRANHYSLRTEKSYVGWVWRFIRTTRMPPAPAAGPKGMKLYRDGAPRLRLCADSL